MSSNMFCVVSAWSSAILLVILSLRSYLANSIGYAMSSVWYSSVVKEFGNFMPVLDVLYRDITSTFIDR